MATRRQTKLDENGLWNYALRILTRRAYSSEEIKTKLSLRATSPPDVSAVLAKLDDYGFVNDQKFSEAFASARQRNDGFGPARVLRDLRGRKVPAAVAQSATEKAFQGQSQADLVESFLQRKYKRQDLAVFLKEQKNFASAYRKLRLAGFASGVSLDALRRHSQSASEWELPDEMDELEGEDKAESDRNS